MRRFALVVSVTVIVALIGAVVFAYASVRRSFPDVSGSVTVSGLSGDVTITRDDFGIPQIYADTAEDLFFAQGYVHAQDRFFEMDFRRHVTSGRLAELFGESAVDTDKFVRTLGWRRVAEREYANLDGKTQRLLKSYAAGVNGYMESRSTSQLSLEYAILGLQRGSYQPERWSPVDSVAWIKAMAWDLNSNMDDEIDRVLATEKLDDEKVAELYPPYPPDHHTIVGQGTVSDGSFTQTPVSGTRNRPAVRQAAQSLSSAQDAAEALPKLLGLGKEGIGSNSWVVDGRHTASGKPLLANDPHLAASMPGVWYQVGLHCRTVNEECPYDVSGFSFSGLPGVVIGHNRDIAWGFTTLYADVSDLYLEKVDGDSYELDGQRKPLTLREETIKVAGGDDEVITVRSTDHGPIISDLDADAHAVGRRDTHQVPEGRYEVSLRWAGLDPEPTIKAVFALNSARNWNEFRSAAKLFNVPSQNLVYADTKGNIGYQAPGSIPIRGKGDGRWPAPGWDSAYDWKKKIPFDELPRAYNPGSGMIVTANNKVIGDQYPYIIGADHAAGYRSERIRELLSKHKDLTVGDMTRIQFDAHNPIAAELVPYLLDIDMGSEFYRQGQELLRDWDFQQTADSAAAAYFNAVWTNVLARTFHDDLPEDQWPGGGERWFNVMRTLLDKPSSPWWNNRTTAQVETRDEILMQAMRDARNDLTSKISRDPDEWSWGRLHTLTLRNETLGTSGISVVERIFNRGPYPVSGGGGLVNATSWDAAQGYEATSVPSMRMVVDLADLDRSRWIQLTGNSGHAFEAHYLDQFELWQHGKTLPWLFSAERLKRDAEHKLTLSSHRR